MKAAYEGARHKIEAGKTHRSVVQQLLGKPLIADENLRLEIYRSEQADSIIYFLAVFPVPAGRAEIDAYLMVVYNRNWIAKGSDYLLVSEPTEADLDFRQVNPTPFASVSVHEVDLAGYFKSAGAPLFSDWKRGFTLLVPYSLAVNNLPSASPASRCLIYITSFGPEKVKNSEGSRPEEIILDGYRVSDVFRFWLHDGPLVFMKKRDDPEQRITTRHYLRMLLTPGVHSVTAKWLGNMKGSAEFSCSGGETRIITIFAEAKGIKRKFSFKEGHHIVGFDNFKSNIAVLDDTTQLRDGKLLIYNEGNRVDMKLWPFR